MGGSFRIILEPLPPAGLLRSLLLSSLLMMFNNQTMVAILGANRNKFRSEINRYVCVIMKAALNTGT